VRQVVADVGEVRGLLVEEPREAVLLGGLDVLPGGLDVHVGRLELLLGRLEKLSFPAGGVLTFWYRMDLVGRGYDSDEKVEFCIKIEARGAAIEPAFTPAVVVSCRCDYDRWGVCVGVPLPLAASLLESAGSARTTGERPGERKRRGD
jgi:hypothetical protein